MILVRSAIAINLICGDKTQSNPENTVGMEWMCILVPYIYGKLLVFSKVGNYLLPVRYLTTDEGKIECLWTPKEHIVARRDSSFSASPSSSSESAVERVHFLHHLSRHKTEARISSLDGTRMGKLLVDQSFMSSILASLPGVDPNDPSVKDLLGSMQSEEKKKRTRDHQTKRTNEEKGDRCTLQFQVTTFTFDLVEPCPSHKKR